MLYSYSWLKDYIPEIPSPETLMADLTVRSVEVEGIIGGAPEDLGNVVVTRVLRIAKHPNADSLNVGTFDVGEEQPRQIVFGQKAPLTEGMLVPVALAPTTIPGGIKIKKSKLRGEVSEGMCCLNSELGIMGGREEVLDIDDATPTGTLVSTLVESDDVLLDIDNKSMTHRSDLFSHAGMAQEIAAVFDLKTAFPMLKRIPKKEETIQVDVQDAVACPRYMAVEMTVDPSLPTPDFIAQRLQACGIQLRGVVVDISNYVMLEYGQPTHAFDAHNIEGGRIMVRRAAPGEQIELLNGSVKVLSPDSLVIADSEKVLAVAGVMGGMHSGVQENTQRIVLEIALFDAIVTRKAAQHLGVRTESSLRYEKGLPQELVTIGAQRAVDLLQQYAAAEVLGLTSVNGVENQPRVITLPVAFVQRLTGVENSVAEIKALLHRLQCTVAVAKRFGGVVLHVTPPWFRRDLNIPEDCIEEIIRLRGIDSIPQTPITGVLEAPASDPEILATRRIKQSLVSMGLSEVLTYSFYGEELLHTLGYNENDSEHVEIQNPLSDDLRYLRVSLLPRMLEVVRMNQQADDALQIFEIGHVYTPTQEARQIGIMMTGELAVQRVRGVVEALLHSQQVAWRFEQVSATAPCPFWNAYAGKKAIRYDVHRATNGGNHAPVLGTVGQLDSRVAKKMGIQQNVAFATISLTGLVSHRDSEKRITLPSPYPQVAMDLSLLMDEQLEWQGIDTAIRNNAGDLLQSIEIIDTYTGSKIAANKKSVTCRVTLQSAIGTLEMKELELWRESLMADLGREFGVELRAQ